MNEKIREQLERCHKNILNEESNSDNVREREEEKSRIRETLNLSADPDSSTDTSMHKL